MKRRDFLQKTIFGLGIIGFTSLPFGLSRLLYPEIEASPSNRIPLPGALAELKDFNAACIGCGLCGEVCPPKCVLFHKVDGSKESNTPYIDPSKKSWKFVLLKP